jgi:hypothetical protein
MGQLQPIVPFLRMSALLLNSRRDFCDPEVRGKLASAMSTSLRMVVYGLRSASQRLTNSRTVAILGRLARHLNLEWVGAL